MNKNTEKTWKMKRKWRKKQVAKKNVNKYEERKKYLQEGAMQVTKMSFLN